MFRRFFHTTARALQKQTKDQTTNKSQAPSKPDGFMSRLKDCYTPSSEYFIFAFMNAKLGAKQRLRSLAFFTSASAFVLLEDRYAPWGTGGEIKLWRDAEESYIDLVTEAFRRQKAPAIHENAA